MRARVIGRTENDRETRTTLRVQPRSPPTVSTKNSPTLSQPLARAIESALLDHLVLLYEF
jgi:hypothetical protein